MYFLIKESPVNFPDPIKHGIDVSPNARDLIKRLLEKNRKKRLGAIGDVKEILAHPFFAGIDWKRIRDKKAPNIPEVFMNSFPDLIELSQLESEIDTRNFDKFEEEEPWYVEDTKPRKTRKVNLLNGLKCLIPLFIECQLYWLYI